MKRKVIMAVAALLVFMAAAAPEDARKEAYIRKYAAVAVQEMYRSGVPASITLAQGILESRSGQSTLAVDGNNHFGIKCHDWTGKKMYYDDDSRGECFRVYDSAEESFRDHSDFLRYRDRYKSLFDNDITDYTSWAKGLKKAGYATDPAYPSKLIKIIEDFRLYEYDKMRPEDFGETVVPGGEMSRKDRKAARKAARKASRNDAEASSGNSVPEAGRTSGHSGAVRAGAAMQIPASPHSLEEPERITPDETFTFPLNRQAYSVNGVPFIYAAEGESYGSIAAANNLFLKEILRFNDDSSDRRLEAGTIVYLQQKKSQAVRGMDKYISDEGGETLREIAQRFAVRLKDLCEMNSLGRDYVTAPGDEIILRGKRK